MNVETFSLICLLIILIEIFYIIGMLLAYGEFDGIFDFGKYINNKQSTVIFNNPLE